MIHHIPTIEERIKTKILIDECIKEGRERVAEIYREKYKINTTIHEHRRREAQEA